MVCELSNETGSVVARLIQRSLEIYAKTVNLNLYNGHFSYIFDFSKYDHSYACLHCSKMWNDSWAYHRHVKSCTFDVRYRYPGSIYQNPKAIFEKLHEHGVNIPAHDRFITKVSWIKAIYPKTPKKPRGSPCIALCLSVFAVTSQAFKHLSVSLMTQAMMKT